MRLLILFISILISLVADSQIINASPPYRVKATAACSYLLDTYSGAAAAYSLRKLDADYAGSAIRVRRSSDNTEQDIGFIGSCQQYLDTSSLKTFVGTGGTDDGFIVTWYDQSGNSRDVSQTTAAYQPKIVSAGVVVRTNGYISAYGLESALQNTSPSLSVSASTIFVVFRPTGGNSFSRVFTFNIAAKFDYENYAPLLSNGSTFTDFGSYVGGYRAGVNTISTTALNIYTATNSGSSLYNSVNNGTDQTYSTSIGALTLDKLGLFATTSGSGVINDGNLTGYICEVVFYGSDNSANKSNINTAINSYYSVY